VSIQARPRTPRDSLPRLEEVQVALRIGLIGPAWFPVPPPRYGGTERVVSLLANGLTDAGHDVTLFASGDSSTRAKLSFVYEKAPSKWIGQSLPELHHCLACYERADEFDVINDHSGLPAAAIGGLLGTPVLHTVHGPLDRESGDIYEQIARVAPRLGLISLSLSQRRARPHLPWVANCPNALDLSRDPWEPTRGEYLLFLGRMGPDKGAHRAIAVALEAGLPLKIAAKCREPEELDYFHALVEPHLGKRVEYLGEVTHTEAVQLLQHARATLFPIEWEEPFGLVMIESMACGTPVIATRFGAVPEVIEHGHTGIIVDDYREMAAALEDAEELDPGELRQAVEERFSPKRLVANYLDAYRRTIRSRAPVPRLRHARRVPSALAPDVEAALAASGRTGSAARSGRCDSLVGIPGSSHFACPSTRKRGSAIGNRTERRADLPRRASAGAVDVCRPACKRFCTREL
jgi:glycosyltransferase involved in cell wall biosynthesis